MVLAKRHAACWTRLDSAAMGGTNLSARAGLSRNFPHRLGTMALRSILIADDEESIRHLLTVLLTERGYDVRAVSDGEEALRELQARDYHALVTDVRMPKLDGLALVRAAQAASPETTIIVMSAYGSHQLAIEAMKAGAYDYLGKPFRPDEVLLVLRKAEERERLRLENLTLWWRRARPCAK